MKSKVKTTKQLPCGLLESDLTYPKVGKEKLDWNVGESGTIKMYECESSRRDNDTYWVICTLRIGGGRGQYATARTYGIRCDNEGVVTVGRGPHVKREVTVYVRQSRVKGLNELLRLYNKGLADANHIRNRVSSRRAQGQLERASGNTYWRWNS